MSFPLSSPRFSSSAFSSVFHSINPSTFKKQKKVPSALTEVRQVGLPAWGAGDLEGSWSCSRLTRLFGTKRTPHGRYSCYDDRLTTNNGGACAQVLSCFQEDASLVAEGRT